MSTESSKPWRPFAANCCSAVDQTILSNFSRCSCRPSRSEFSKNVAPLPSFRRLSYSDPSRSSSPRINHDLAQCFGPDLYDFQLSELRAITHNFSTNYLLGDGGFGTVHKGYVDETLRQGLKAQAVAVKLLNIEGLQVINLSNVGLDQIKHHFKDTLSALIDQLQFKHSTKKSRRLL